MAMSADALIKQADQMVRLGEDPTPIFHRFLADKDARDADRLRVLVHCVALLEEPGLHTNFANALLAESTSALGSTAPASLVSLAHEILARVRGDDLPVGRVLELLPPLLSRIAAQDHIAGEARSGPHLKAFLLNRLCSGAWPPNAVIRLANAFRMVEMTPEQLRFALDKLLRSLNEIALEEMPALVYQLLLLSSKGHKEMVLRRVNEHFDSLHHRSAPAEARAASMLSQEPVATTAAHVDPAHLRSAEGTVLLHYTLAIRQQQDLGREFMKYLKAVRTELTPFTLALALCLCGVHRFADTAIATLQAAVLRYYKDLSRVGSPGLPRNLGQPGNVEEVFERVLVNSAHGWDHIIPGLMRLGFYLLDGHKEGAGSEPQQKAAALGEKILTELFRQQDTARVELLDQLVGRVISKSKAEARPPLQVLRRIIATHAHQMAFATAKIKSAYDFLGHLPAEVGCDLVDATLPLVRLQTTLSDTLLLVLRKSLFHREANARCVAVHGYLQLLRLFSGAGGTATSASSADAAAATAAPADLLDHSQVLCQEVAATLRRVVAQQREVRECLYHGLAKDAAGAAQGAGHLAAEAALCDLLEAQLRRSLIVTEDRTTLNMEHILLDNGGRVERMEPIGALLMATRRRCSVPVEGQERSEAMTTLAKLAQTLARNAMEDFELDPAADFTTSNPVGQRNRAVALTLLEAYECALSFVATQDLNLDSTQAVCALQRKHESVLEALKDAHRKHKMEAPLPQTGVYISGAALAKLFHLALSEEAPELTAVCAVLRNKANLTQFLFDTASAHLSTQAVDPQGAPLLKAEDLLEIASTIIDEIARTPDTSLVPKIYEGKNSKAQHAWRAQAIDVLRACLVAIKQRGATPAQANDNFNSAITALEETLQRRPGQSGSEEAATILTWIQKQLETYLPQEAAAKETSAYVHLMEHIVDTIPGVDKPRLHAQASEWLLRLCEQTPEAEDAPLLKATLSFLFHIDEERQSLLLAATSCLTHTGSNSKDTAGGGAPELRLLPRRACENGTVPQLILNHTDLILSDIDWALDSLAHRIRHHMGQEAASQDERAAEKLCATLCLVIDIFVQLLDCVLEMRVQANMLKHAKRLYETLSGLLKVMLLRKTKLKDSDVPKCVIDLVHATSTSLYDVVYASIEIVSCVRKANSDPVPEKKSKGRSSTDARIVPNLIYAIESYERYVIQLSKKSTVDLTKYMKGSKARDFRVTIADVTRALAEVDDDDENDSGQPSCKKAKGATSAATSQA